MDAVRKLFVVPNGPTTGNSEHQVTPVPLQLSGDAQLDAEAALRALAFLVDFVCVLGPDELRRCADEIRAFRVRQ